MGRDDHALDAATGAAEMMWISVKDSMPEVGVFCLAFSPEQGEGHFVGYLEDDGCWKSYVQMEGRSNDIEWVTHWMPLPDSPTLDTVPFPGG